MSEVDVAARMASIAVVLVRTEGALNLGSVARLCGNFGCALRLVDVRCDATSKQAVMMAHPAETLLATAARYDSLAEALADVDFSVGTSSKIVDARDGPVFDVKKATELLPPPVVPARVQLALVFGNERTGMSVLEAAQCQRLVRLQTPGQHDSLNLSHAIATMLALFAEAAHQGTAHTQHDTRAQPQRRETLVETWLSLLSVRGYFRAHTADDFRPRLREIVDKMDISDRDVELMFGMLRVLAHGAKPKAPHHGDADVVDK